MQPYRHTRKETIVNLPAPVRTFFDADKGPPDTAPLDAFASDAVVEDEGRTHAGPEAIGAWWRAAKAQYHHRAEPCEIHEEQDRTLVRAQVTGQFPGSPALINFAFRLVKRRIAALRIGA